MRTALLTTTRLAALVSCLVAGCLVAACSGADDATAAAAPDTAETVAADATPSGTDAPSADDAGLAEDTAEGAATDAPPGPDVPEGDIPPAEDAAAPDADAPKPVVESEPNDGSTLDEFNAITVGESVTGTVGSAGDTDIFGFQTTVGHVYRVALTLPEGSTLQPHVAVIDDGRDGDPPGSDQVRTGRGAAPIRIDLLAMGNGGYLVAVRDVRNLDTAAEGGAGFDYVVTVTEVPVAEVTVEPLTSAMSASHALPYPGALHLYPFTGTEGEDVLVDVKATGGMDGRLMIYAEQTGSWIARNDNRSAGDRDPLIDAPLFASGPMLLVVDNIEDEATDLAYTVSTPAP